MSDPVIRKTAPHNFSAYYKANEAVFETLRGIDSETYRKYLDWMSVPVPGASVLDVGCGVGYVANVLAARGYAAYGVDANHLAIDAAACAGQATFQLLDDYYLPYPDGFFDCVGSYTVIEHVGDPELFLSEQVRVLKPGGRFVVACPNFLKFVGLASHHPRTRGFVRKIANAVQLFSKAARYHVTGIYEFEMMQPIVRPVFEPDDDAIVVTNPVDMAAALQNKGLRIVYASGTDRYFSLIYEKIGETPILRSIVGAVFVVAEKLATRDT